MADFTIRSDQIDVEQIMRQIRAPHQREARRGLHGAGDQGTGERQARAVLDPRALRSDLLAHYRVQRPPQGLPTLPPHPTTYAFDEDTLYTSHRGPLRWVRRLLNPLLKLFFNPNPLIQVLHLQGEINDYQLRQYAQQFDRHQPAPGPRRDELDGLNYEVLNNLVLELTRLGIEVKNLKMRVESLSTRLDFDERRARALEGLVQASRERPPCPTAPPRTRKAPRRTPKVMPDASASGAGVVADAGVSPATVQARLPTRATPKPQRRRHGPTIGLAIPNTVPPRRPTTPARTGEARRRRPAATGPRSTAAPNCTPVTSPSTSRVTTTSRS